MGDTLIHWTDRTLNPIRAENILTGEIGWYCEHVSRGCGVPGKGGCYADGMNQNTYFGNGLPYKASSLKKLRLFLDEKILMQPLHWRAPKKVFMCSMTDLFGRFVKDEWIDQVFAMMALAPRHVFQVLTKRPDRMRDYMSKVAGCVDASNRIRRAINEIPSNLGDRRGALELPLFNVHMGVSVEDQATADERIPLLLETPAVVRFVSYEPALGPVDFEHDTEVGVLSWLKRYDFGSEPSARIDWVICGGESGPKAEPMHPDWARLVRDQCVDAGVPFHFKQWGQWQPFATQANYRAGSLMPGSDEIVGGDCGGAVSLSFNEPGMKDNQCDATFRDGTKRRTVLLDVPEHTWGKNSLQQMQYLKVGKKIAGRLLDGREWNEFPCQ